MSSSSVTNDGGDRISHLPESIIIHILSLLPSHMAVQTSLLSTTWKCLWKNIHNLSFDQSNWHIKKRKKRKRIDDNIHTSFALYVNKVLISLNEQCIEKFYLRTLRGINQYEDVTSWIATAISRNVKVIEFDSSRVEFKDCSGVYTCKTLEILRLNKIYLSLPSLISLPNLKTLGLARLIQGNSVSKLISSCSSLENLDISDLIHYDTLTILSPTLRNLSLEGIECSEDNKIVINAPQLRYLNLDSVDTIYFSVKNLCLLDEARIFLYFDDTDEETYDRDSKALVKLLQGLYNVKTLSLGRDTYQALSHAGVIPRFSRLSKLTVEVDIQLKSLLKLLESLNELQFLTISLTRHYCREEVTRCWSEPEKIPICFLSSLETISIHGIRDHGFEMIVYMLENAKVLTTMEIQAYDLITIKAKLLEKILNLRRGSENCQVIFLNPM